MNAEGPDRTVLKEVRDPQHALLLSMGGMPDAEIAAFCDEAAVLAADPVDLAIGEGRIREEVLIAGLASAIGGVFRAVPPPPAAGTRAEEAFALRSYLLGPDAGGMSRVISPNGAIASILLRRFGGGMGKGIVLTGRQALLDALVQADGERIARRASSTLPPRLSATPLQISQEGAPAPRHFALRPRMLVLALILAVLALALAAPAWVLIVPPLVVAPVFIIGAIAVLTAVAETLFPAPALPDQDRARLPRYTLLVPLYKEEGIAGELVSRLDALTYPRDRLEILILLEADDEMTAGALGALALPASMLVLRLPAGEPRTKPRALNAALPFASGDLLVVYDAEDAPEPDQLLKAAALFAKSSPKLACAQGRLAISNVADCLLTRRYAIEYAALFDCVKSGSARLDWPVPLGGSSNHFRGIR